MCLAGGGLTVADGNVQKVGGRIDTTTLAEILSPRLRHNLQAALSCLNRRLYVWAEEPNSVRALWGQRLRWGRGNIQVTLKYKHMCGGGGGNIPLSVRHCSPSHGSLFSPSLSSCSRQRSLCFTVQYKFRNRVYFFPPFVGAVGLIYLLVIAGVAATDPTVLKRS